MNLLKELQQKSTNLYSTLILNDAEEMTDQLLFMKGGHLIEHGSLDEVKSRHANPRIRIRFHKPAEAVTFAEEHSWKMQVLTDSVYLSVDKEGSSMQQVLHTLSSEKQDILGVEFQTASLEEIFLKVVAGQ